MPNYGWESGSYGDLLQKDLCQHARLLYSVPLTPWHATTDPHLHQRLLDTHRQAWVSLLWCHCSFLLGLGVHNVLFVPSKCVFPQSCVKFWQLYGGINGDLLQEGLCHTQGCCTQSPWPCGSPLLTRTSAGDSQTLKGRSGSVSVGSPGALKVLFEPSECLWWVWYLILDVISPLLPSCWGFSFCPWIWGIFFWWDPTFC